MDCNKSENGFFGEYGSLIHKILEKYEKGELSLFELNDYYEEHFSEDVPHDAPPNKYFGFDVVISIIKDRLFGSTKEIPVYYDQIDRRFYSNYDEFDRIYGWDNKKYVGRLPYPIVKEEFPDK